MQQLPRITIITPTLNQSAFIERSILSVLNQGYPNLQYIIIDGGSSDSTVEVIKKYQDKISFWISEKDNGQSHAINKGLKKADGDIVNWLNSDDELLPGALEHLSDLYQKNPGKNLFIGRTEFYRDNYRYGENGQIVFKTAEITLAIGQVNQPAMFYKREVIEKLGYLNESLHYCMDIDWWMKYLLMFGIDNIQNSNKVLVKFNFHDRSKTVLFQERFQKEKEMLYVVLFSKTQQDSKLDMTKVKNNYHLWRADEYSVNNEHQKTIEYFKLVNPLRLGFWGLRRYFGVLKNIIL
jgi:glycosyltransferase involved in cell wall biosynthesis